MANEQPEKPTLPRLRDTGLTTEVVCSRLRGQNCCCRLRSQERMRLDPGRVFRQLARFRPQGGWHVRPI